MKISLLNCQFVILLFTVLNGAEIPGHGICLNGENSYVLVPDKECLDITGDFTVEFWSKIPEANMYAHLLSKHQPGINDDGSWVLKIYRSKSGQTFVFSWPYKPNEILYYDENNIGDLGWFHFAVCYNDKIDSISFWLNGDMVLNEKVNIEIRDTIWPLYIGSEGSYNYFKGYLSEIRISTIVRYRQSFRPSASFLPDDFTIAYWPCNEGEKDTLHDLSQHNNNGQLFNVSWLTVEPTTSKIIPKIWIPILFVILGATIIFFIKRKKGLLTTPLNPLKDQTTIPKHNHTGIFLFGGFRFIDISGKDLTKKFSPLTKQLLVFILLHSLEPISSKGISTGKLTNTFWPGRDNEKAKNARGTALNKLRKILEESGICSLVNRNHLYQIEFFPSGYCDFLEYTLVKQSLVKNPTHIRKKDLSQFLEIVENGTLLPEMEYEWLDAFKASTTNEIMDLCLSIAKEFEDGSQAGTLLKISSTILTWDTLNEEALRLKIRALTKLGRHGAAKDTFENFRKEYFNLYGEEINLSFHKLIGN